MKTLEDYKKEFEEKFKDPRKRDKWTDIEVQEDIYRRVAPSDVWQFIEGMAREILKDAVPTFDLRKTDKTKSDFADLMEQINEQLLKRKSIILGEKGNADGE